MCSGGFRISQTRVGMGANSWVWGKNLLFDKIFAENCMKMKEIGLRRGRAPWVRQLCEKTSKM